MYYFILRWGGQALNKWGMYALIVLSVLGFAALWEIFEYYTDLIFGNNAQGWKGMAEGQNPMTDTILDIVVAVIGAAIFFLSLLVDGRTGGRLYGSFVPAANDLSISAQSSGEGAKEAASACTAEDEGDRQ